MQKKITLKINNISVGQWSTLILEINSMAKSRKRYGPEMELQAPGLKRILTTGTSNKPQAASPKNGHKNFFWPTPTTRRDA